MDHLDKWIRTRDEIDILIPKLAGTLAIFYDKQKGFRRVKEKKKHAGGSIISHSRCIEASMLLPKDPRFSYWDERSAQIKVFHKDKWKKDQAFNVSVALPGFTSLLNDNQREQKQNCKLAARSLDVITKAVKELDVNIAPLAAKSHALFLYRLGKALSCIEKNWLGPLAKYKKTSEKVFWEKELKEPIGRLRGIVENRLFYFISMCEALPDNQEDAVQLGYLVYSLVEYNDYKNDVLTEYAIRLTLNTLFKEGQSIRLHTILRESKDGVNRSAYPIELLTLLASLRHVRRKFLQYSLPFEIAYDWLRTTKRPQPGSEASSDSTDSPVWMAEPFRGVEDAEAWINASVIEFLVVYRLLLEEVCASALLLEFGATTKPPKVPWRKVLDSTGFKAKIERYIIDPTKTSLKEKKPFSKCSAILFGPPGTAKTTTGHAIAAELGLPFVVLAPHHFADEGLGEVIRRTKGIFQKLLTMKRCVVLLDEIDELVAERKDEHEKIGRFITTSVLPWFQALHDRGEIIFIVTTNRIEAFDSAIKRPGRFDVVAGIGPPKRKDIKKFLKENLQVSDDIIKEVVNQMNLHTYKTEEGDPTGIPWQVTIGELKFVCEQIREKKIAKLNPDTKNQISRIQDRLFSRAMISYQDAIKFQHDLEHSEFPPAD